MAKAKIVVKSLESFKIHELDLKDMFRRAKYPKTIKMIAMPDTHVVHRDHQAIAAFLEFLPWYKPHAFTIMGDFLDCEAITHWPSDELRHRDFVSEIIEARELLAEIVKRTPNCNDRLYLTGNHEDWIRQALGLKLPEFFTGLDKLGLVPDLKALLDLDSFDFKLLPLNDLVKIGKAHFTHGYYTSSNHPKTHLDRVKSNIYYGHLHDEFSTHQSGVNGTIEAASLGCLCRLDAKFTKGKPTNWVHGFGVFEFFPDGTYTRIQVRISNGKFSFAGRVFGK